MTMPLIIGLALAASVFAATYYGRHLTLAGAALLSAAIAIMAFFRLWMPLLLLFIAYGALIAIAVITARHKKTLAAGSEETAHTIRSAKQLFANGFAAFTVAILYVATAERAFLLVYAVAIGEVLADSVASDVGVFAKKAPRDICTWQPVAPGTSGGVSPLGAAASVAACFVYGLAAYFLVRATLRETLAIMILPLLGSFIDSLLGSRVQAKYRCAVCGAYTEKKAHCETAAEQTGGIRAIDNCAVNFISNIAACGLGAALLL